MCIRDRAIGVVLVAGDYRFRRHATDIEAGATRRRADFLEAVSYTHLRAHETVLDIVCRLLLEKKNNQQVTHTLPVPAIRSRQ